ncbi:haloacid dehalogenase type II, partial [Mycobacterium tuberculosis]
MTFKPKYVTFDCYGTLTRFRMKEMTRDLFADRIPADRMEQFIADFAAYRFDEVLGAWQPYEVVLKNAVRRLCRKWKVQY